MRKLLVVGAVASVCLLGGVAAFEATRHGSTPNTTRQPAAVGASEGKPADIMPLLRTADAAKGEQLFAACAACHSIGRGGQDLDGPNLYGVVGSRIADRRPRFAYTASLRAVAGTWSFEKLNAWLANPKALAPGTSMSFAGLSDAQERADVIAYLNTQGSRLSLP